MTKQNMNTNKNDNMKDRNTSTYGDPIIATSPTINNEYKRASSTIAESTQNPHNSQVNDSNSMEDPSTYTAYGDPIIKSSPSINGVFKKATSSIAEDTQNGNSVQKQ